jgi:hypothetical protein
MTATGNTRATAESLPVGSTGRLLDRLTARPRVVFVNIVSELMIANAPADYARRMVVVTPRELYTCFPGDVLVLPCPVSDAFRNYCLGIIGVDPASVTIITTPEPSIAPLATHFSAPERLDALTAGLDGRKDYALDCFAADIPTVELSRVSGVPMCGYDGQPPVSAVALYHFINTKSGFKQIARELGLPVLESRYCTTYDSVLAAVGPDVMGTVRFNMKPNRGSNGYGHFRLDLTATAGDGVEAQIRDLLFRMSDQPPGIMVEPFVSFVDSPSTELHVAPSGPMLTYTCSMRVPGGAFTGMLTPPAEEHAWMREQLEFCGRKYGEYLHEHGVYGFCDVDAGIASDGSLFLTESNLRRTGGTYLDILMRRLAGENYLATHAWLADSHRLSNTLSFEDAVGTLESKGLAYSPGERKGVILTADTLALDGRLRYLCVGRSIPEALELEARVNRSFGFSDQ